MKTILILMILIVSSLKSNSQVTQEWEARYNGPSNSIDRGGSIVYDNSGNVFVTGSSNGNGSEYDFVTIKYNPSGIQEWIATYNGPGNSDDYGSAIVLDNSGNVYVTGSSFGVGSNLDYATIKYNSDGVLQWVARYNGIHNSADYSYLLSIDNAGNVYVSGHEGIIDSSDFCTIKYNTNGEMQWVSRYNGPGNFYNQTTSLVLDDLGNAYVTGSTTGIGTGFYDYVTIKYNSVTGNQEWVASYNGPGPGNNFDEAFSSTIDESGNIYVTGSSNDNNSQGSCATIKYNSNGVQQWVARYRGTNNSYAFGYAIKSDAAGNVYVTGYSFNNVTDYDYLTIKYNSSGDELWAVNYNGTANGTDIADVIAVDNFDNIYVSGRSKGTGSDDDYLTIKYDSSGNELWTKRYNGPGNGNDRPTSLKIDDNGNLYLTGYSLGSGSSTDYDYATIKYSQSVGINQISTIIPEKFSISQNYPNPFNPTTKIKFDLKNSSLVKIVVFDMIGKEVATLVNENLSAGSYESNFDGSKLTSGIYFYRIETENYSEVKKMTLLK